VSAELLPRFLPPTLQQWQPSDFLPDATSASFLEDLQLLRGSAAQLPNDLLVVLSGVAVSEAVAPNGLSLLNSMQATGDETGAQTHAWAR
jgi:acyl-[acyl-carrier-protein] desaturase